MRSCGIISALLLALIAVPAFIISILYNGVAQTIFVSPSFVARLAPAEVQTRYRALAPYLLQQALNQPDSAESMMTILFPNPETRATMWQLLPPLLAKSNGDLSPAALEQLTERELPALIEEMLRTASPCTAEEESAITSALGSGQLPMLSCAPRNPALTQQFVSTATDMIRQSFDAVLAASPAFGYSTQDVTRRISELRAGALQSIILPATLTIMIVALAVRSRRQLFGWIGGLLLASSVGGLPITLGLGTIATSNLEQTVMRTFTNNAGALLPFVTLFQDPSFQDFVNWSTSTFLIILGVGVLFAIVAIALPAMPTPSRPRGIQPMGAQMPVIGDGSTHRVKTDFDTNAIPAELGSTSQLPPGLDTSKLTFGRRLPKIPQPTQQITDMIPVGDQTSPIPVNTVTETLDANTHTQELGPKEDSRATQRTDEHRF